MNVHLHWFGLGFVFLCLLPFGRSQDKFEKYDNAVPKIREKLSELVQIARNLKIYVMETDPIPDKLHPSVKEHGGKKYKLVGYRMPYTLQELEKASRDAFFKDVVGNYGLAAITHLVNSDMMLEALDYLQYYIIRDRLLDSTMLASTIEEADYVLVSECNNQSRAYFEEEARLLENGQIKEKVTRLVACGCSPVNWYRRRLDGLKNECPGKGKFGGFTYGTFSEHDASVMTPYVTDIHNTKSSALSESSIIFGDHQRDILLTFQGSIDSSRDVRRERFAFINNLVASNSDLSVSMKNEFPHGLKHLFYAPHVDGLKTDAFKHKDMRFRKAKAKGKSHDTKFALAGTYGNAHFCLNPPGDNIYRRAVWDSIQLGCIPVIYESQADGHRGIFNQVIWNDETGLKFEDVFWVISEDIDKQEFLKSLLDALNSGEVVKRRLILQTIATYTVYSWEDVDDAFLVALGALHQKLM